MPTLACWARFITRLRANKVTNGKVTGGTGAFAGATGKITAKSAGKNREAITITYST